ncbi:MAG: hypothetical protein WCI27_09325, partial [Candidatus Omnitrophota bacterium]
LTPLKRPHPLEKKVVSSCETSLKFENSFRAFPGTAVNDAKFFPVAMKTGLLYKYNLTPLNRMYLTVKKVENSFPGINEKSGN